ncbi:MAG TPA: flagellar biosynthesis protein FlhF [Candidatus Acidoferrum sp.]|nr:flagellar biosynthesis protein FlhF [Candidatus Acidoferrum sp.]
MHVEKFVASDMRQAMNKVREAFGNDAVILSSRRIDDMTEITAARDYVPEAEGVGLATAGLVTPKPQAKAEAELSPVILDMQSELNKLRRLFEGELAQLAWRDMSRSQPNRYALINRLESTGIDRALAGLIVDQALPCDDVEAGWRKTLGLLGSRIKTWDYDLMRDGGVVALVGSTGVGKTTTAAKIAARFATIHGRKSVAFISTDCNKVGGQEQLVSFGGVLGIPVQFVSNQEEMQRTLDALSTRKLVVIDTAGMSQRDKHIDEQMAMLTHPDNRIMPMLALPATARTSILDETVLAYHRFKPVAAILTKLDECDGIGPVLSSAIRSKLPLAFSTNGQKVPDDMQPVIAQALLAEIIRNYKVAQHRASQQQSAGSVTATLMS